jgi:hypothetical protein
MISETAVDWCLFWLADNKRFFLRLVICLACCICFLHVFLCSCSVDTAVHVFCYTLYVSAWHMWTKKEYVSLKRMKINKYKVVQIWPGQIAACLHTNQSRSYLNHLVHPKFYIFHSVVLLTAGIYNVKTTVFWAMTPNSLVEKYQHFGESTLNMEALCSSKVLVSFYWTTRFHIPGE